MLQQKLLTSVKILEPACIDHMTDRAAAAERTVSALMTHASRF